MSQELVTYIVLGSKSRLQGIKLPVNNKFEEYIPLSFDSKNNIQEKFNPVITTDMKIFSFVQMLSIIFVSGSVLLFSQNLAYVDIAIFGVLMVLFSTLNSRLLENKNYS